MQKLIASFALVSLFGTAPLAAQNAPDQQPLSEEETDQKTVKGITATIKEISQAAKERRALREASTATLVNWRKAQPQQADYPPPSWLAGEEGLVVYDIAVDQAGKATRCEIRETSGHPALDDATCAAVMKRGEFQPAQNEAGEAAEGVYRGRHFWRKRTPEVPGTFRFKATFTVDEHGRPTDCVIDRAEGDLPFGLEENLAKNPCPFGARSRPIPYRDENGVPVAKRVVVEFSARMSDAEPKTRD
ncbi:MAG: TonB family protein [Pseudomonadota bacterium]